MRVTLVKPNLGRVLGRRGPVRYVDSGRMEPLQLGVLAGLTPPEVDVRLYDDRLEDVPFAERTDLAAITIETFTARRAYEIAAEYRSRGVPVVLGGMHPTLLPDEAAGHADAVVTGDAESVWGEVLADAAGRRLRPRYDGGTGGVPQDGVRPRRDLFAGKGYLPITLTQFSRGCPYRCHYCATSCFFHATHRHRSGCQGHVIGFESLSDASLRGMRKGQNRAAAADGYAGAVERLRSYGLQTWAAFTVGHDADTAASIRATADFAIASKFTFAAFNVLMPYPGTPLYAQLAAEGRLLHDGRWWLHPDYRFNHAAFIPALMSADELTAVSFECRRRFNAPASIARRLLEPRTNLRSPWAVLQYLAYNPLFRREVYKKQDLALGYRP